MKIMRVREQTMIFILGGGEMETIDYGDYESYDSDITNSEFIRMDESKKIVKVLREQEGLDASTQTRRTRRFWRIDV